MTLSDEPDVHRLYSDPDVTRTLSFDPRTREEVDSIVETAIEKAQRHPRLEYMLAVALHNGEFMGTARLALDSEELSDLTDGSGRPPHSGQLGGALKSSAWRHGYAEEGGRLLLKLGFEDLGLHRIWGARGPQNEASRRLMLSLGMTEEALLRDHVYTQRAWRDSIVHAILAQEYQGAMSQ